MDITPISVLCKINFKNYHNENTTNETRHEMCTPAHTT